MPNITAGNISPVISDHLIHFWIKLHRSFKNFNQSNPDSNVALEHFLQIINKLLDKHAPYIMSNTCLSFASKPWITMAIANFSKIKNKIYKNFSKEKTHNN